MFHIMSYFNYIFLKFMFMDYVDNKTHSRHSERQISQNSSRNSEGATSNGQNTDTQSERTSVVSTLSSASTITEQVALTAASGGRPIHPVILSLMMKCWGESSNRPSFDDIVIEVTIH